jgi:hypothetical protein
MNETQSDPSSFSDAALTNSEGDRFRRAPFAKAIAETLSSLRDKTSIAIGIYGPWGDGKTTVLSFIEEALRNDGNMITMYFNPWRFGDEDELLHNFFQSLVGQLGKSLSGFKEFVNKWKDAFGAVPYVGTAAEKIAAKLTVQKLEEFKTKTEEILEKAGKRIVVLMDDIDRLETGEIQSVFRLIKLTASLNYVAYVLAFDDKVVSAALQEKYGNVSQSGQGFLEKIIQVPLQLPKIPTSDLLEFCHECVNKSLATAKVELLSEERNIFEEHLAFIADQIHTPRQCKRYANGVTFAFGILKGEVNASDLLLIEALRIFHPALYKVIRENPAFFIAGEQLGSNMDPENFETEVMRKAWDGLNSQDQAALRKLLVHLFPYFGRSALQRQKIGLYDPFADRQRIASKHYFDRFFTYSIPANDISDREIAILLRGIRERPVPETASQIHSMIKSAGHNGSKAFIDRIALRQELLSPSEAPNLARGIAAVSQNFFYLYEGPRMVLHFSDAVHLVRQLLLNTPDILGERHKVLADIVRDGTSLPFAYCCLLAAADPRPPDQKSWFEAYGSSPTGSTKPPISKEEYDKFAPIIAQRMLHYFDRSESYEISQGEQSKFLVELWPGSVPKDDLRKHLKRGVQTDARRAVGIVSWYLPDPFDDGTVSAERYRKITELVEGATIVKALETEYGVSLRNQGSADHRLRKAQEFIRLHEKYSQSTPPAAQAPAAP